VLQAHSSDHSNKGTTFFYLPQEELINRYQALVEAEVGIPEDTFEFTGGSFSIRATTAELGSARSQRRNCADFTNSMVTHFLPETSDFFWVTEKAGINDQIIKTAQTTPAISGRSTMGSPLLLTLLRPTKTPRCSNYAVSASSMDAKRHPA